VAAFSSLLVKILEMLFFRKALNSVMGLEAGMEAGSSILETGWRWFDRSDHLDQLPHY